VTSLNVGGVALVGLSLLVAGCGGGSRGPSVASVGGATSQTTTTTGSQGGAASGGPASAGSSSGSKGSLRIAGAGIAFSACMRSHGVSNFPDPDSQGAITFGSGDGVDPNSARFQYAQKACRARLPNGGAPSPAQQAKMQTQALKFSACMRSHGLPKFPDPTFSGGGVTLKITSSSGIDPGSPQFQAAQKACQSDMPGKPRTATDGG
jgi:hypothetical protein